MDSSRQSILDHLIIIWAVASKDILDALKNRLVIALILVSSIMLLLPKMLPLIFEPPTPVLVVYDPGNTNLAAGLAESPDFNFQKATSLDTFENALCSSIFPTLGLVIPSTIDSDIASGHPVTLAGYVCWNKRLQAESLGAQFETLLSQSLDQPVSIAVSGNFMYPPPNSALALGMIILNAVTMVLLVGLVLVPHLLFEEKQTKTIDALLVSPASISQVVAGKALAGFFYVLVAAGLVYAINWLEVTHWWVAIVFALGGGLFAVAGGLVLGSIFDSQQEMVGWMSAIMLLLLGAGMVQLINLQLPAILQALIPWIPSVALGEIFQTAFTESVDLSILTRNLGIILVISLPLYAFVIWKVRQADR